MHCTYLRINLEHLTFSTPIQITMPRAFSCGLGSQDRAVMPLRNGRCMRRYLQFLVRRRRPESKHRPINIHFTGGGLELFKCLEENSNNQSWLKQKLFALWISYLSKSAIKITCSANPKPGDIIAQPNPKSQIKCTSFPHRSWIFLQYVEKLVEEHVRLVMLLPILLSSRHKP